MKPRVSGFVAHVVRKIHPIIFTAFIVGNAQKTYGHAKNVAKTYLVIINFVRIVENTLEPQQ